MSFTSNFYGPGNLSEMTPGEIVINNTVDKAATAMVLQQKASQQLEAIRHESMMASFRESNQASADILADEIRYQTAELMDGLTKLSKDVTQTFRAVGDYLGAELSQLRWAVDQNTEVTQQILDAQLKSHWHNSRQFYEVGVQCYMAGERELAKGQFEKAVDASVNNSFAYQYLGFLAVDANDQEQTLRNFDRAAKFAPDSHQRALAHYHLTRAWFAAGDNQKALENARLAVEHEPDSKTYQYELVRALMRAGNVPEAIAELRKTIESGWNYWSICATDRSLNPMRSEVTALLAQMREEKRTEARRLLDHLDGSIKLIQSFDQVTDRAILGELVSPARENYSRLQRLYETGIVFSYLAIVKEAPVAHDSIVREARESYENACELWRGNLANAKKTSDENVQRLLESASSSRRYGERKEEEIEEKKFFAPGCLWPLAGFFGFGTFLMFVPENAARIRAEGNSLVDFLLFGPLFLIFFLMPIVIREIKRHPIRAEARKLFAQVALETERAESAKQEGEENTRRVRSTLQELESLSSRRVRQLSERLQDLA